jgi:hypothetical protein
MRGIIADFGLLAISTVFDTCRKVIPNWETLENMSRTIYTNVTNDVDSIQLQRMEEGTLLKHNIHLKGDIENGLGRN